MLLDSQSSAPQPDEARVPTRARPWLNRVAILALISGSTCAVLLCPCDHPGGQRFAELLLVAAFLLGIGAAILIYRELERRSNATGFMRGCGALVLTGAAIYLELTAAMDAIGWLARGAK
jgi:hypothetical protein